jgi:Uma2 family endonuclease
MKAVMSEVPEFVLQWRKRTGAEKFDEMWDGVLHMVPASDLNHQFFIGQLERWLNMHWVRPGGRLVCHDVNVCPEGGWPDNYRIPGLVLLTPDSRIVNRGVYIEGGPAVVVEVQSPHDETLEKLSFYAQLGVPEVWIFDRDTKQPRLLILEAGAYSDQAANAEGWLESPAAGVRFRRCGTDKLTIELARDPTTRKNLPED